MTAVVAETVIGADGAFSGVARAAGWPRQRTVPLLQAVVKLPKNLPSDTARVWFLPNETPYFRLLDAMSGSARRLLSAYTRDEATPLLLRLCVGQPRFMFLGLRALLTAGLSRSAG